jgi:uncharacterized protein DUF5916
VTGGVLCAWLFLAQAPGSIQVHRAMGPLRLDGAPDEAAWQAADSITEFTQQEPDEGRPATERTVVRLLATDGGLYVALWAFDSQPAAIRRTQLRRDAEFSADDRFSILLDPLHDQRSGLLFTVNANAALEDAEVVSFENSNEEWDGVWDARARLTEFGWTAEIFIPWQTLRYRPDAHVWGANFRRVIRRKNEEVLWRAWRRTEGLLFMAAEGTLEGLSGLPPRRAAEVRPYAAATSTARELVYRADGSDSLVALGGQEAKGGVDAKVGVTGSLTLDLTAHTDFAQVDVDQQVVNLTRFPLFFPEKRPFFLESSSVFEFGQSGRQQLFYSRRIGLGAGGSPIQILAGARLTGRVGPERVGVLAVRTGSGEDAWDFVARVRHDVLDRGHVGAMLTSRSVGGATAAGADFNLPFVIGGQNLVLLGFTAATRQADGAPAGGAARFGIDYPNDLWDNFIGLNITGARFEPALGFVSERDALRHTGHFDFFPRPHRWGIRRLHFTLLEWDVTTHLNGARSHSSFAVSPLGWELNSGDEFAITLQRFEDAPDEAFEIFPGDTIPAGGYWYDRVEVDAATSSGRPVTVELTVSAGEFYTGTGTEVEASVTIRAAPHIVVDAAVEQQEIRLASRRFTARAARLRLDVAATPRAGGTLFLQHDNESDRLGVNARLHWVPKPGSDVFLVWNGRWPTGLDGGIPWRQPQRGQLVAKVVYYFRL